MGCLGGMYGIEYKLIRIGFRGGGEEGWEGKVKRAALRSTSRF